MQQNSKTKQEIRKGASTFSHSCILHTVGSFAAGQKQPSVVGALSVS